jgi:hypothetical protein
MLDHKLVDFSLRVRHSRLVVLMNALKGAKDPLLLPN